jgi:subtilisin family serine protease
MTCSLKAVRLTALSMLMAIGAGVMPVTAQSGDSYIVSFDPGTSRAARAAVAARSGAALRHNYGIIDAVAITVPNDNALQSIARDPSVRSITPDYPVYATQSSNAGRGKPPKGGGGGGDGSAPQVVPLGVARVVSATAGDATGLGIGVAIVDTGLDLAHADLQGQVAANGRYNALDGSTNCQDDNGHGTHVGGIVAAANNSIDVVGVAPRATLYCVKVLNAYGSGAWSTVIAGLNWIWQVNGGNNPIFPRPVRVVNMSLTGSGSNVSSALRDAIQKLRDEGVIVVVAAGNDPNLSVSQLIPAAYDGYVLTVASTTAADGTAGNCPVIIRKDTASSFTTDGPGVTISAPGGDWENTGSGCLISTIGILSLNRGGGTTRKSGTSMATPHVSGIVARLLERPYDYGVPAPAGNRNDFDQVKSYITDASRGADLKSTAPLNSPASSYTFDGIREGIAVIRKP